MSRTFNLQPGLWTSWVTISTHDIHVYIIIPLYIRVLPQFSRMLGGGERQGLLYTALRSTVLHEGCAAATWGLFCSHYPSLHCTALQYNEMHCIALHWTVLQFTALYFTALHYYQGRELPGCVGHCIVLLADWSYWTRHSRGKGRCTAGAPGAGTAEPNCRRCNSKVAPVRGGEEDTLVFDGSPLPS